MSVGADDEAIQVAGENPGGIGNAFPPADLGGRLVDHQRVAAQFADPDLEGDSGAGAVLVENHSPALVCKVDGRPL